MWEGIAIAYLAGLGFASIRVGYATGKKDVVAQGDVAFDVAVLGLWPIAVLHFVGFYLAAVKRRKRRRP